MNKSEKLTRSRSQLEVKKEVNGLKSRKKYTRKLQLLSSTRQLKMKNFCICFGHQMEL